MRIINSLQIPPTKVNHDSPVQKVVVLENGTVPKLTNFSLSTLLPGQSIEEHKHETKYEIFYLKSGKLKFTIHGKELSLGEGNCIVVEPKEVHSLINSFESPAEIIYFGVATE